MRSTRNRSSERCTPVAHDLARHRPRRGAPLGERAHAAALRGFAATAGDDLGRSVVVGHVEGIEAGGGVVGEPARALRGVDVAARAALDVGHLPQAGDDARDLEPGREQRAYGRAWRPTRRWRRLERSGASGTAVGAHFGTWPCTACTSSIDIWPTVATSPLVMRQVRNGPDDVAVLVELHGADHADIAHRLLVLDELQRARKPLRAGVHHFAARLGDLADRVADRGRLELAGVRDGQSEDRCGVERAVGRRRAGIEAAAHRGIGLREELGRRRLGRARRRAERVGEVLRPDALDEVGRIHAVVEQEALRPALLDPGANDGGAVTGIADEVQRRRIALERIGHLGGVGGLLCVVRRHAGHLAAQCLEGAAELGQHVDAEVVVHVDDRQRLHVVVDRVLRRGRALQRIAGDGAEEPAAGLAFVAELGQRRRRRRRRDLHHAGRPGDRRDDRDRHRADDAADDRRHLLQVDQLARLVDRHRALALRIAQVEGELATGDAAGARGLVQFAERQLDRLRSGLAEAAGGTGQRHHHADRVRARWSLCIHLQRHESRSDSEGRKGDRGAHRWSSFRSC